MSALRFDEVFAAEREDVKARREAFGLPAEGLPLKAEDRAGAEPAEFPATEFSRILDELCTPAQDKAWKGSAHDGLVGLALSGGGIRSATFNLGVLQVLKKYKVFVMIDYLSTVSGGGYIGSCLSSIFAKNGKFPFIHEEGTPEPRPFRHLRDYSNYLAPKRFRDLIGMPALLIRGLLINFLTVFPYILLAAWLTVGLKPTPDLLTSHLLKDYAPFSLMPGETFLATKFLLAVFAVLIILCPMGQRILRWTRHFGTSPWALRNWCWHFLGWYFVVTVVVAFVEVQPIAINAFAGLANADIAAWYKEFFQANQDWITGLFAVGSVAFSLFGIKFAKKADDWKRMLGLYAIGVLAALAFWLIYLDLCRWAIFTGEAPGWMRSIAGISPQATEADAAISIALVFLGVAVALLAWSWPLYNANNVSLHNFYRDRLSKAYLFEWPGAGKIKETEPLPHNDGQLLSSLNPTAGPYHLINTALNMRGKRGRNADFFTFSRRHIGGALTGYCRTEEIEELRDGLNLGTAMAISGAAAAPNMGTSTIAPLRFIMAMVNVRLNYWLPNPRWVRDASFIRRNIAQYVSRVGPEYLFREMFGDLDETSWNVNLSDGGHIDNLGLYELLRRECRLIIASDAECDEKLRFKALATAIRLARIDLGIATEIEGLRAIRNGEQHYATGTIKYKGGRIGKLIYLKSSPVGPGPDTPAYVWYYGKEHRAFPHESTADQFFSEEQFECYRALGYEIAETLWQRGAAAPPGMGSQPGGGSLEGA